MNQSSIEEKDKFLNKNEILNICQKYFDDNEIQSEILNIKNYKYISNNDVPKGFLGEHRFLNVQIDCKTNLNQLHELEINFFIKSLPINVEKQLEYCENFGVFKKEIQVYRDVIPILSNIHKNKIYNYKFSPKCYLIKNDLLIFENLINKGYHLGTRYDGTLDYNHLLCALDTLAKMHSSSIIFESKENKLISDLYPNCIKENSYPDDKNHIRSKTFENAASVLCELLKIIPKYKNLSNLNSVMNLFIMVLRKIFELCKASKKYRNVFSHGDLWANNLMFKYEISNDINGNNYVLSSDTNTSNGDNKEFKRSPVNCYLVDFQLTRYSPPMVDIMTVLTIPTSSEFRKQYMMRLLDEYYKFLKKYLSENDVNIDDHITKSEYYESIKYYKVIGIIESCLFSHLTLLPDSIVSDMLKNSDDFDEFLTKNRESVCLKAYHNNETYRNRMTDMITDLIDNYVLC